MNFSDYKNQESSEKLTLAVVHASKRLMAWSLHSGSLYKLENFDYQAIVSIEDSGNAYNEVFSISDVTASKFYNDRENKILYLRTTGSDNPNGRFLVLTYKLFFSNNPITLPHDLSTGDEVYWEPMIKTTSAFGVEIDTVNGTSEAIEGSGTLTLFNDSAFWKQNYDKITLENKPCYIYSYNRNLDVTEAKPIFKGFVESKTYSNTTIELRLRDLLSQLRNVVQLDSISELSERNSPDVDNAKQRMIFGKVSGHRLVNLDEVNDGYTISGTISITIGLDTITGSGTAFLNEVSPDDQILLDDTYYTVATVTSDTVLTLSEVYNGVVNISGSACVLKPDQPKRYMNRKWFVAGHVLRQPVATVQRGSTISRIKVDSTEDMRDGDWVYFGTLGSGSLVKIDTVVSSTLLKLSTSLIAPPSEGTTILRPSVQNVRIDDVPLVYYRDYTFDASTGILTLRDTAEKNAAPLKQMPNNITFTSGNRVVSGTNLDSLVKPGSLVGTVGQAEMFQVLSVDSPTQITLTSAATYNSSSSKGLYKTFIYDPENSVVTCDVLGRTVDGTTTGALLKTAPDVVKTLLSDAGLSSLLDTQSFTDAAKVAYQEIGLVIPEIYSDEDTPTYREVLNRINPSVFGSVVQNSDFELSYLVLQPSKSATALKLQEHDVIDFKVTSKAENIVKTSIVEYNAKEYNYLALDATTETAQKTSDIATYLLKTDREKRMSSVLVNEADASRHAKRWALILDNATTIIQIKTKLQAIDLEIGSIVDLSHRKLFERFGSTSTRRLGLVESVKKNGNDVELNIVDLSNLFNRIGSITDLTTTWADTDEDGRIYGGFITDDYGLIDNDPDSYQTNLIW